MTRTAIILLATTLALTGCKKKPPANSADDMNGGPQTTQVAAPRSAEDSMAAASELSANFRTVRFALDSDELDDQSKTALTANGDILSRFRGLIVEIQGHADEQGTTDYNLALGQRRAMAVRNYLISKGANAEQLRTVSFGEERPAVTGHAETAYSQNRRAEFRVIVADGIARGTVQ